MQCSLNCAMKSGDEKSMAIIAWANRGLQGTAVAATGYFQVRVGVEIPFSEQGPSMLK